MDINPTSLKISLTKFIKRYHLLIFTVLVLGGLVVCMFMINNIIIQSSDAAGYEPAASNTSFDQETIDRIKKLYTATDGAPDDLNLGQGRSNPFVE